MSPLSVEMVPVFTFTKLTQLLVYLGWSWKGWQVRSKVMPWTLGPWPGLQVTWPFCKGSRTLIEGFLVVVGSKLSVSVTSVPRQQSCSWLHEIFQGRKFYRGFVCTKVLKALGLFKKRSNNWSYLELHLKFQITTDHKNNILYDDAWMFLFGFLAKFCGVAHFSVGASNNCCGDVEDVKDAVH